MKIFGIIVLIFGFVTFSYAQDYRFQKNKSALKPNKIEFRTDSSIFQPQGNNSLKYWQNKALAQNDFSILNPSNSTPNQLFIQNGLSNFSSSMPIYKPNQNSNMPIMKPDSIVHYHMLVKKIEVTHRNANQVP